MEPYNNSPKSFEEGMINKLKDSKIIEPVRIGQILDLLISSTKYESIKLELKKRINNYDANSMSAINGSFSFKDPLESWLNYQSVTITIAVSAEKYKISDLKILERFYRGII